MVHIPSVIKTVMLVLCGTGVFPAFYAFSATYYFDSQNGNDGYAGTSPAAAWRTLTRFNATTFAARDTILFRRGSVFTGLMQANGAGSSAYPVVVDAYGTDTALPRINGGGITDAVLVSGVDYWEISNLEITNQSATRPSSRRAGVRLNSTGGTRRHIHVKGLYVHDVNGNLTKGTSTEGCGILFDGGAFSDLLIENCHVVRTDRNGICQQSSSRSTGVVIRGNLLEDIGGDCIKLWGTNHGLVEHNVVRGGHMRCLDLAAGIWPFSSDSCIFQFNEVSGMKSCADGMAFDVDYITRGTVFQYNYSHDNEGGFLLICAPGSSYCDDYTIRYNISRNDGISAVDYVRPPGMQGYDQGDIFLLGGKGTNGRIYNNTIFVPSTKNIRMIQSQEWDGGRIAGLTFSNNIFWSEGQVGYNLTYTTNVVFENNVFYGNHTGRPTDAYAITVRPPLVNPGNADTGWGSLSAYAYTTADTGFLGRIIANNGGRDILGTAVPSGSQPMVGAVQGIAAVTAFESFYRLEKNGPWMKIIAAPGSPVHTVIAGLVRKEPMTLTLVNTRGQALSCLFSGNLSAGKHRFTLDTRRYARGVLFIKLKTESGGFVAGNIFLR
ncbi:MAG: right-handed parallel beta-helix repeat-containing protein [Chitinispirillaceae bacterium]|nr:right-handed parallel beta-helix repeat-containing protein [Chitinispirillaceae bacterium]